jgi:aspartate/tyrosine/aromatic aminotransferase
LSGTGALRVGFEFLNEWAPSKVLISNPTWANHQAVIRRSGLSFVEYPYYDPVTKKALIGKFLDTLNQAQEGNIVLLHVCAHNPTGVDPSQDEWKQIAEVMKKKNLFPFFDSAYQGFASGDIVKDAFAVRHFVEQGFNMLVAQSYAKNMGLYGERIGALHIVTPNK